MFSTPLVFSQVDIVDYRESICGLKNCPVKGFGVSFNCVYMYNYASVRLTRPYEDCYYMHVYAS